VKEVAADDFTAAEVGRLSSRVKEIVSHNVDSKLIGPSLSTGYRQNIQRENGNIISFLKAKARSDCRSITV
jgi:hypothetical protein